MIPSYQKFSEPIFGGIQAPTLNLGGNTLTVSKSNTANSMQTANKMKEYEDPCFGMPKEFFFYELDKNTNICLCKSEQLRFIANHYPEYYKTPIDIPKPLYDVASSSEDLLY